MSYTTTQTHTYTTSDIETVLRRFTADLVMIAQSSGAMIEASARNYAHDIELLAKSGYLKKVDITLLSGAVEMRAAQYLVNTKSGALSTSRPGGVLWPRVVSPFLRIIITHTDNYDAAVERSMKGKLKVNWTDTYVDTSHIGLLQFGSRDYVSNGWGMQRKDFAA